MWRFRGTPHYLSQQGDRLGLSRILTDRARHNPEIHRVSVLLGQLCERWHRCLDEEGNPHLFPPDLAQVKGTLSQCEQELEKLHALAAAAQAMIDEAHRAFNLAAPERVMRVWCLFDENEKRADVRPIRLQGKRERAEKAAVTTG
jgi:hypothetical protein